MAIAADPVSLAVECPRCGQPPLSRCVGRWGDPTPTHVVRRAAGQAAREAQGG